jgi:hypothetical protein
MFRKFHYIYVALEIILMVFNLIFFKNERIVRPILRRESSSRTKAYSKRKTLPAKSSIDVCQLIYAGDHVYEHQAAVVKSVEHLNHNNSSADVLDEDEMTPGNNCNTKLTNLLSTCLSFDSHFEERAIDAYVKAELHALDDIVSTNLGSPASALKKLLQRSKSVDSINSNISKRFDEHIDFKLSREDSLPPSYPSIFAERLRNGFHSETHLYLEKNVQLQQEQQNKEPDTSKPIIKPAIKSVRRAQLRLVSNYKKNYDAASNSQKLQFPTAPSPSKSHKVTKRLKISRQKQLEVATYTNKSFAGNLSSTNEEDNELTNKQRRTGKSIKVGKTHQRRPSHSPLEYSSDNMETNTSQELSVQIQAIC